MRARASRQTVAGWRFSKRLPYRSSGAPRFMAASQTRRSLKCDELTIRRCWPSLDSDLSLTSAENVVAAFNAGVIVALALTQHGQSIRQQPC